MNEVTSASRVLKLGLNDEYDIQCGYEAGCLGYSLYNQLTAVGIKCVILAPTTMLTPQGVRIKTDMRDAYMIPMLVIWWLPCCLYSNRG